MDNLVISNLKHRLMRTVISVAGVALGVCLTLLTVGTVHGMILARAQREANVGAEIMVLQSGSVGLKAWSSLRLPVQEAGEVSKVNGVRAAVPVGQYFTSSDSGFGLRAVEGIPERGYRLASGIELVDGRWLRASADEAIVDVVYAEGHHTRLNDRVEVLGHPFRIVGVYAPASGPRVKVPLAALQRYAGTSDRCSMFYVKCWRPQDQERVAQRIQQHFPDRQVILTRNLPAIYAQGTPAINTFLNVVVGLEAIISVLVILLTMYTTIKERTREIGVLKSLGASKSFIASVIEKEAFFISGLGVVVGFGLSFLAKVILHATMGLTLAIEARWLFLVMLIGLASGLLGALYPALSAANQDAVRALCYE